MTVSATMPTAQYLRYNFDYQTALIIAHQTAQKIVTGLHDHFLFLFPDGSFLMFRRDSKQFDVVSKETKNDPTTYYIDINEDVVLQVRFFDRAELKSVKKLTDNRPKPLKMQILNGALAGLRDIFREVGI